MVYEGAVFEEHGKAWIYDWVENMWTRISNDMYIGDFYQCHAFGNSQLMVIGGKAGSSRLHTVSKVSFSMPSQHSRKMCFTE